MERRKAPSAAQDYLRSRGIGAFVGVAPDKASAQRATPHSGTAIVRGGRGGGDSSLRTGVSSDWGIAYRDVMERKAMRAAHPTSLAEMATSLTTRRLEKERAAKGERRRRRRARRDAGTAEAAATAARKGERHSDFSQRPEKGWICTLNSGTALAPAFTCLTRNPNSMAHCIACGTPRERVPGTLADTPFDTRDFILQWKLKYGGADAFHVEIPVDAVSDTELEEVEEYREHAAKFHELEHAQHVQHVELLRLREDVAREEREAAAARAGELRASSPIKHEA